MKKLNDIFLFMAIPSILALALIGCGGGGDVGDSTRTLHSMDIVGAKALIIAPRGVKNSARAAARSSNDGSREVLYKLTEEGLLIEVKYLDEHGEVLDSQIYRPEHVEDLTEDYIYVRFSILTNVEFIDFLVRKEDGVVFATQRPGNGNYNSRNIDEYFASEVDDCVADGSIYYKTGDAEIRRIDISNPESLIDSRVSPVSDRLTEPGLWVDKDGNVLYGGESEGTEVGFTRLIKKNGELADLSSVFSDEDGDLFNAGFFLGPDGNIYGIERTEQTNFHPTCLVKVDQEGNSIAAPYYSEHEAIIPYDSEGNPVELYDRDGNLSDFQNGCVEDEGYDLWYNQEGTRIIGNEELSLFDKQGNPLGILEYETYSIDEFNTPVMQIVVNQDYSHDFHLYGTITDIDEGALDPSMDSSRYVTFNPNEYFFRVGDKVMAIDDNPLVDKDVLTEVWNPTASLYTITSLEGLFDDVSDVQTTENYYYLLALSHADQEAALYRIDAATHTPTSLFNINDYQLYKFSVSSDDVVLFHALRMTDGADVTGTIDLSNTITIIEELVDHDIIQLERVL